MWAEALREEYRAITDVGLTVQIDAPDLAESWDQFEVEPDLQDYRRFSTVRIEALNHALEGIDPARVRYHMCWGSWHGPHSIDLGFDTIVDLALSVRANGLSFEAANARHEHEWRIWKDVELPSEKYLIPGVVSHATNVLEHPELVADRIERFASLVGPERVVASTDCGLGGRVHSHIGLVQAGVTGRGRTHSLRSTVRLGAGWGAASREARRPERLGPRLWGSARDDDANVAGASFDDCEGKSP